MFIMRAQAPCERKDSDSAMPLIHTHAYVIRLFAALRAICERHAAIFCRFEVPTFFADFSLDYY